MSIVASAFQYGWAPTLMPATTMFDLAAVVGELDQAPQHAADPVQVLAAAVHRDLRPGRQARTTRSAPPPRRRDRWRRGAAGTPARRSSRATSSGRRGWRRGPCPPGSACVGVRTMPTTTPARFCPRGRTTGAGAPVVVEVVLDERAGLARHQRHQLVRVHHPAPLRLDDLLGVLVERPQRFRRRIAHAHREAGARAAPRRGPRGRAAHQTSRRERGTGRRSGRGRGRR